MRGYRYIGHRPYTLMDLNNYGPDHEHKHDHAESVWPLSLLLDSAAIHGLVDSMSQTLPREKFVRGQMTGLHPSSVRRPSSVL